MTKYIFPVFIVFLLMLFYFGLPALPAIPVKESLLDTDHRRLDKTDAVLLVLLTLFSGITDFIGLGNTESPQTFTPIYQASAELTLSGDTPVNKIMLFTGVGTGNYTFTYEPEDGSSFVGASYEQNYATVLKWETVVPETAAAPKKITVYADGNAYLGELVLLDENDQPISYTSSIPALCDEQELVPAEQTYLNSTYFDEIYHARTAWEHLNGIYPYEISHPPLGKLILALGIALFGMTPFGWRFSGTLIGVLMVPILYVFTKKMFGSRRISAACSLLLATDFMHFVQTRIATIDSYAVFFILLMYLFLYLFITEKKLRYLALCGISFGIGAACKWTCIYAGAGLGVIWAVYWIVHRKDGWTAFLKNAAFCVLFFVLIPAAIYYLSYLPYGIAVGKSNPFTADYFKIFWNNQLYMFRYHSQLNATHPYSSRWYQWIFDIRPILYYMKDTADGMHSRFGAFVNPMVCWGGFLSLFVLLYYAVFRRERTAAFLLCGYLAQLIPWVFITRVTFEYHYFPCTVFLILSMGYIFRLFELGSRHDKKYIWGFTGLAALLFVLFYPVLSGKPINGTLAARLLAWLPTWPF